MMDQQLNLIFELKDLKKTYKENTVLSIGRLQFHRGTIYGIVGPIGSGKTTLLNIMAGLDSQSSGTMKYDNNEFKTNWFGKIKQNPEIKLAQLESLPKVSKVSEVVKGISNQSVDQIYPKFLQRGSATSLLDRHVSDLSTGELYWLNMVSALESDPRVLMIDNYGIFSEKNMESKFRNKLRQMNKELGTTIVLAASNDQNLITIASVLIYLDNGHVSKVRTGVNKKPFRRSKPRKFNRTKKRSIR
jgi:ABC-type multidrug transport system ATPase subunit